MSEDSSIENLRRLLGSDEPDKVHQGLSLAKGSSLDESLAGCVLFLVTHAPEKEIRVSAGELFEKYASEEQRNLVPLLGSLQNGKTLRQLNKQGEQATAMAVAFLIETLRRCDDWPVRRESAEALGHIGDVRAVKPLIGALEDENAVVVTCAAISLGIIRDARAVDPLISKLEDEDDYVRLSAVESLGCVGDTRAYESLQSLLDDDDQGVREAAAEALEMLGTEKSLQDKYAGKRTKRQVKKKAKRRGH